MLAFLKKTVQKTINVIYSLKWPSKKKRIAHLYCKTKYLQNISSIVYKLIFFVFLEAAFAYYYATNDAIYGIFIAYLNIFWLLERLVKDHSEFLVNQTSSL